MIRAVDIQCWRARGGGFMGFVDATWPARVYMAHVCAAVEEASRKAKVANWEWGGERWVNVG